MKPKVTFLIAFVLSVFIIPASFSQSQSLSWAGAWQYGTSSAVAVDTVRSYAFLSSGGAVLTYDVSDPTNPLLLNDSIRTTGQVLDIHVDYDDQNLLLACDEAGMEIWDVNDVQNPSRISNLEIIYGGVETPVRHIDQYQDFAVTENEWGYVHTVNISDPANPFQVAFNGVMGNPAHDISVSADGYIHASGQQYFVHLVINPDGSLNLASNLYLVAGSVYGTVEASFLSLGGTLYIIDRVNGGSGSTSATFHDIVVRGDHAYMIGDDSFMIYDVSDLHNPAFVSQVAVNNATGQLDIMGDHAFITCSHDGMRVVDFSDPSTPVEVSHVEGTGVTWKNMISGNYNYLANSSTGVSVIDVSDPLGDAPVKVSGIPSNGETRDLDIEDDVLYFADYEGGLRIYDITDPLNPSQLSEIQTQNTWRVEVNDNDLFMINANPNNPDTLKIYDISSPANPSWVTDMVLPDITWKILFYENHIYVAAHDAGLLVIDVTNPSNPTQVATVSLPDVSDVDIEADLAFVASTDWDGGLVTVDISDPSNPVVLNTYNPNGWFHPFHVAVEGDYVYTGENFGEVKMFDVSDPANPQELDEYVTSGSVVQMNASGNFLYISDAPDGMQILHNDLASVDAEFTADDDDICETDVVNFTDQSTGGVVSWMWTFEGGTPSTSTMQNPSVTYNTAGTYDVELIVSDGITSDTAFEANYITVSVLPDQAAIPSGPDSTCQGGIYEYTTTPVTGASGYEWMVDPADAGTISGDGTTGTFEATMSWTGAYTVQVRASNGCGDGPWSPAFSATLNESPQQFTLTGGGTYCAGTGGLELILDGSETGIDYELFLDDVSTGIILAGTGNSLSFGYQTDEGSYTVTGYNAICSMQMEGENIIVMETLPGQPAMPSGNQMVCNDQVTEYTSAGTPNGETYTWILSPDQAGTMNPDSLSVEITWDPGFTGTAMLSLYGSNECGDGAASDELVISVSMAPSPEINGPSSVCSGYTEEYMTTDDPGSTYTWEVTGGEITNGAGTYMISVLWGDPGDGSVTVTEETSEGCSVTTEAYSVTIDECTGIDDPSENDISIYPNPVDQVLYIQLGQENSAEINVSISDILGKTKEEKVIGKASHPSRFTYDVSHLKDGIYILKITSEDGISVTEKFIKN